MTDRLVYWLVDEGIESLKEGGLFPLIFPKLVSDGLVDWLVGEGIESLKEGGLFPLIFPKLVSDGLVGGWLVRG